MNIRIELTESRSPHFKHVIRLCKKFPTYKTFQEDGLTIHSVEFSEKDWDSFEAIQQMIFAWKTTAYYMNGHLVTRAKVFDRLEKWRTKRQAALGLGMNRRREDMPTLKEFLGEDSEN